LLRSPVSIQRDDGKGTATATKDAVSVEDVAGIVNAHILDYRAMVLEGINSFSPPEDKSAGWFLLALGGNLVWASTCLAGPLGAATVAAMSFGGAIVGSGVVEKMSGDAKVADIKPLLKQDVLTYTDQLKQGLGSTSKQLHSTFSKAGVNDANDGGQAAKRREMAWAHMFDKDVAPW
jgi:hypothetical protein